MAGGEILHLPTWKSVFIECLVKPALLSAAFFGAAWMRQVSPMKSYEVEQIYYTARETSNEIWGNPILEWKMGIFAYCLASFCEADNAYFVFLRRYVRNLEKKWRDLP